jgi:hypothetical protein
LKAIILIIGLILGSIVIFGAAYALTPVFEIKGTGVAMVNGQDPKLYITSFRMSLADQSTISKGYVIDIKLRLLRDLLLKF